MQHLGIAHLAARHPLDLSGGESRLVGLGMVLDTGADTLLLDEPTAGLDADAKRSWALGYATCALPVNGGVGDARSGFCRYLQR